MRVEITKCDVCGTEKKQANHWFVAFSNSLNGQPGLTFHPWAVGNLAINAIHLCGQACAQKQLNSFLVQCTPMPDVSS